VNTGKRWHTAIATAAISGLLAWLSNPIVGGDGVSWSTLGEPRVVIPGLIAFLTTLYAFLQPSTHEGAMSERNGREGA